MRCIWPRWLLKKSNDERHKVSLYRHKEMGLLWGVRFEWDGPSSYEPTYHCIAIKFYKFRPTSILDKLNPVKETRNYFDIHQKSREIKYQEWDGNWQPMWWKKLELVSPNCVAPKLCKRPKFFTKKWVYDVLGKTSSKGLSISLYWHPTLHSVYAISDDGLADARVPFFTASGMRLQSGSWQHNIKFINQCETK